MALGVAVGATLFSRVKKPCPFGGIVRSDRVDID